MNMELFIDHPIMVTTSVTHIYKMLIWKQKWKLNILYWFMDTKDLAGNRSHFHKGVSNIWAWDDMFFLHLILLRLVTTKHDWYVLESQYSLKHAMVIV